MNIITPRELEVKPNAIDILSSHNITNKQNILLLAGSKTLCKNGVDEKISNMLAKNSSSVTLLQAPSNEPAVEDINTLLECSKDIKPDLIIVFGGGSAMDTAKALALLTNSKHCLMDYLNDKTKKPDGNIIPIIAIPTTSGTGSEATKNAVISITEKGSIKSSIRYDSLMPVMAILDPTLLVKLPKKTTAESGFDALAQLIESCTSSKSNAYTDNLSLWGLRLVKESFEKTYEDGGDISSREKMLLAAYLSGVCLANGGLGAAHGVASVLGMFGISHGAAVALTLPHVMELNYPHAKEKFGMITDILCKGTQYKNCVDYAYALREKMNIASKLQTDKNIDLEYLAKTANTGSMLANTYALSLAEIETLIKKILQNA